METVNTVQKKRIVFGKGISLVEVVIAISILTLVFFGVIGAYNYYMRVSNNNVPLVKAAYLLEEGVEAVKIMRDTSWASKIATLSSGTNYYLTFDGSAFNTTTTESFIDSVYVRKVIVSPVYRDGNSDIASSGILDANTKQITVSVSWFNGNATTTKEMQTYVANIFNN